MKKENLTNNTSANVEEVDIMPTIELVECERVAYVKGMQNYLQKLKSMSNSEAIKKSRSNLESSNIITKDGEFTDSYSYSRGNVPQKG